MILNPDFREFVALLNAHNVRFLIVGGYAVAFHGHPRYTKDLDIWIDREPGNTERLTDFGFGSVGLKVEDFLEPDMVIQLGHPPNRIDLVTSLEGVDFSACHASKVTVEIEGVPMPFIDLENLKRNKKALGRHQDWADLENLE